MKLVLRGHHLLCLQGFQGYGYNDDFVKNMTDINKKRKSEDTTILLTNEADNICEYCPNLKNDLCQNQSQNEVIKSMDNEVLSHIDATKEHDSLELFAAVENIFNSKESVDKICCNCRWHDECLFYQKL